MVKMSYFTTMKVSKNILLILVFSCSFSFSQNVTPKLPLNEILSIVEKQFDVKFSYAVEDVKGIEIKQPNTSLDLSETIKYLNSNTLLNFKLLDSRYITVSVINKTISICGRVRSSNENSPLFGASISINTTSKGTITNDSGIFNLDGIPINASLTISYLGYQSEKLKAFQLFDGTDKCNDIILKELSEELNQVLITKFLTVGLQKRLDGSVVLNTEQFGILPGLIEPDILQSIQALPGVESTNESIANINVRGGTNDQNLMLWDNIKMYHSGHFFGLISAYNPNLTSKVIVSKNGTSSEFSDGVSSTVNMFTKNDITNKFSGGAGLNLISADAFLEIPITKTLEIHLSGRRSFTDLLNSPTYENYFDRSFQDSEINIDDNIENSTSSSDFYFYDYTAKLLFDLGKKHKFRANIIGINNNLDYSESLTNNNQTASKSSSLIQENLGFGANWEGIWTEKFSTNLISYYSKYNVDANDLRLETNQLLTQTNEVLETGVKLNTHYKPISNLNLLLGYQINETGILNETTVSVPSYGRTKKDVLLNHAVYAEAEYKLNNTYLRAGIRLNYFDKFDKLLIEPRINIRQKLNKQFAIKLEGEFKNQSATQIVDFQDDFLGVENRRWILANEVNIPISTSQQGSFGIDYNQNNLNVDLTSYYKVVDGITASNQGFYNNFQFLNATGSYIVKGIEFLVNKTSSTFSTWLSYTYSINDYEFQSFTPSQFPNNVDIRHSLSLAFNYNILKDLEISIGGIYRSGQPFTKPVEGNETVQNGSLTFVNYDTPNSENLDYFMRLDASLGYNFILTKSVKANLNIGVRNITNEQNVINRYYKVDPNDNNKAILIDNKSLGLTPNASFRVRF